MEMIQRAVEVGLLYSVSDWLGKRPTGNAEQVMIDTMEIARRLPIVLWDRECGFEFVFLT